LFSSSNRTKGGIKWGFVAYVAAMFSFVTVYTAMFLNLQSISYIDNREFPGNDDVPPGPLGYQWFIHNQALSIVPNLMFILNNWLADGFLIYRCCVIYSMNYSVVAFPSLVFLGSFATGLWFIFQTAQPNGVWNLLPSKTGLPYFSISSGLSVLLTLIILARLVPYSRNVRSAVGGQSKISGFYRTTLAILIESCGLYAMNSLLFIIPWGVGSYVSGIFLPILGQIQVIAPFLLILRIANKSALTDEVIMSGKTPSSHTGSQENSFPRPVFLPGSGISSIDRYGGAPGELSDGFVSATIDLHDDGHADKV